MNFSPIYLSGSCSVSKNP